MTEKKSTSIQVVHVDATTANFEMMLEATVHRLPQDASDVSVTHAVYDNGHRISAIITYRSPATH